MTQTQRLDVRELINRNPLSRFQKQIIFLGFCVIALDGFDIAIMGFIAPTLKLEWGVSNHQLGLVISAALIGLARRLAGTQEDHHQQRLLLRLLDHRHRLLAQH